MEIKNRNAFRLTRFILLKVPLLFRFLGKLRSPRKRLLIIKTDAIGDYILFRNFLEVVRTSEKYRAYEIHLLGNPMWKDLALQYDKAFVNEFIFAKTNTLYDEPFKTLSLGWKLFRNKYEAVLQPSSTRTFIIDGLAGLAATKQTIGFESDNEGIDPKYKKKTDMFYTWLVKLPAEVYFEFDRNKYFFEQALGSPLAIKSTSINFDAKEKKGVVLFPGAGVFKRGWEREKFIELIKLINKHSPGPVYIAGGPAETATGELMMEQLTDTHVMNFIGKSSLPQLIGMIGNAKLVIANDTSAIHIAVAAKTPSVCILGGGHFDRFVPYPAGFESAPVCVYEKMECYYCNWNCIYSTPENEPYPCVSKVNLKKVWQAVLPLL